MTRKRTDSSLTLSQIIDGYLLAAQARRLSPHTIADYTNAFSKLQKHLAPLDPQFHTITTTQIEQFLAAQTGVTGKTLLNYHTALSALYTWSQRERLVYRHILHAVERPHAETRAIVPYTESDIKLMLTSIAATRPYLNRGTLCTHQLPNQERNRAIILLLLDTGLRAEELCTLTIQHIDQRNARIRVFGKGAKERLLPISPKTAQSIWKYLATRPQAGSSEPAFITAEGRPLDRCQLRRLIINIANRAGVNHATVHKFRHTFAVSFLRNGGDIYTLQAILGHTTLDMCKSYLRLSHIDAATAHRRASPVMNMNL